jgi:hypothetical protein
MDPPWGVLVEYKAANTEWLSAEIKSAIQEEELDQKSLRIELRRRAGTGDGRYSIEVKGSGGVQCRITGIRSSATTQSTSKRR